MWTWGVWMDADLVCHGVPDPLVELLALEHEVAVPLPDDAALGGDGAGRVDIVPGHHPHLHQSELSIPSVDQSESSILRSGQ